MPYTSSQAVAGRGSQLQYQQFSSIGYQIVAEVKSLQFSGQKSDLADVTNMESGVNKEWLPTLIDWGEVTMKANFIAGDASQQAMSGFLESQTLLAWKVILPNNPSTGLPYGHWAFNGYVTEFMEDIPVEKEVSVSLKVKLTGNRTFVAGS